MRWISGILATITLGTFGGNAMAQADSGWPQPYAQVSEKSIDLLKKKGWWPLTIAWQPAFSGQNATMVSMVQHELLKKRGVDVKLEAMATGGDVNQALVSGRAQLGAGGNFPLTLLVSQNAPIRVVAITAPNLKHQVIVPVGSSIRNMSDFKGKVPAPVIGMALGSSAEFYFQASAAANGVRVGTDVILKNMSLDDQIKLPPDVAAVVPWDPTATLLTSHLKVGRAIDVSFPYNVYQGSYFARKELLDEVPDVVKAVVEAWVEAELLLRVNPQASADAMAAWPEMAALPRALLLEQIQTYNLLYKPSYMFPLGRFWGMQNQDIAMWLYMRGKLKRPLNREDYQGFFSPEPMSSVFAQLGWREPTLPPFIPDGWMLTSRSIRLPDYEIVTNMAKPQAWPAKGDLTKPFRFGGKTYAP